MLNFQITQVGVTDLDKIASWTLEKFGLEALDRYNLLIDKAIEDLQSDPDRFGVEPSMENLLRYHLRWSKEEAVLNGQIVQNPRHFIFFRVLDGRMLEVVRILKDDQDFGLHL